MRAIYWIRSDMRIADNETLNRCLSENDEAVFVFAQTKSLRRAGKIRRRFVDSCAESFRNELEGHGIRTFKTDKLFAEYFQALLREEKISSLYFTEEYAWEEKQEEKAVEEICHKACIRVVKVDQGTLIKKTDLPFKVEDMPFVFTDFRKRVESSLKVASLSISKWPTSSWGGSARVQHYLWSTNAIQNYKHTRNGMILFDDSSKLSPWLSTGNISSRMIYHELKKYENEVCENESTYWLLFELLWRDYLKFFSLKFGRRIFLSNGITPGKSANLRDKELFQSWCSGNTPDDFINANMNELNQTGWMSNRGRLNVASYLIHDLGIDWTWGAAYFEEKLFDYDPDLNWGNWLYLSGRGSDPRARKFNTSRQAETYDSTGEYRRLWAK